MTKGQERREGQTPSIGGEELADLLQIDSYLRYVKREKETVVGCEGTEPLSFSAWLGLQKLAEALRKPKGVINKWD